MTEEEQLAADLAEFRRLMAILSPENRKNVVAHIQEAAENDETASFISFLRFCTERLEQSQSVAEIWTKWMEGTP